MPEDQVLHSANFHTTELQKASVSLAKAQKI
jgi:hypothetical protein